MVKSYQGVRAAPKKKAGEDLSVSRFMATNLTVFSPDDSIHSVIATLTKKKITGGPVVDDQNNLVGIISQVDCLKEVIKGKYNNNPSYTSTVKAYMTTEVMTLSPDDTIFDAAAKLSEKRIRRFPVVEEGKLIGQISLSDVLRAFTELNATNW